MEIQAQCQCGKVQGLVTVERNKNNRFVCLCDDCQTFGRFLGTPGVLDKNGGTEIVPVVPAQLRITSGHDFVKGVRLSPKGMYRWYAGCCRTPIANCPPNKKMPYIGVVHLFLGSSSLLENTLGPIKARIQGKFGIPPLHPETHQTAPFKLMLEVMVFLLVGWMKGQTTPHPFFQGEDLVFAEPYILSKEERERYRSSLS